MPITLNQTDLLDKNISDEIRAMCPQAQFAYLFDSQTDSTTSKSSNFDIAVFSANPCSPIERWNMAE